jgi:hypothetical protein
VSGSHRTSGDGYRSDDVRGASRSGEYGAQGGYRAVGDPRESGGYRTADGHRTSGEYRTSSGGHRLASGSHRATDDTGWGWRMALVIAGAVAGVAACAVAVVMIMGRAESSNASASGHRTTAQPESGTAGKVFTIVPDSCTLVSRDEATKLVDSFQQNPSTASDTDQHSQCVWTDFTAGSGRQLTVGLRLIGASGGRSAADSAHEVFLHEQAGDTSGGGQLDSSQTLAAHQPLSGLGAEAYLTYSQDSAQAFGETGVNVRTANLLVTVRYGGSSNGAPLDQQQATDGAKEATERVLTALAGASS